VFSRHVARVFSEWFRDGSSCLCYYWYHSYFCIPRALYFYFTFMWPCIATNFFVIKQQRAPISQIYFVMRLLYMFRTVHQSIIRSFFTVHSAMVYVIQVCRQLSSSTRWSCSKAVCTVPVWHIPLLSVQWKNSWWWTDELSETCRVSWQNKFVKLVHVVGFITNKYISIVRPLYYGYYGSYSTWWYLKKKLVIWCKRCGVSHENCEKVRFILCTPWRGMREW
jgi:hypothetical protein